MAENHLRNFQFLRNATPAVVTDYAAARERASEAFEGLSLIDGEIALFSYTLSTGEDTTTVHTLLGIKRNGGIEILGNYDELTAEYQSYVANEIAKLATPEGGVTDTDNGVSVTVKQVNGKITEVSVNASELNNAIDVAIAALNAEAFSLTEVDGTVLKGYQISEEEGIIKRSENPETLLTFASEPTVDNKVVTLAEIAALDADVISEDGVNVQVQVIEEGGVITGVNVVTDKTVNATDVNNAITTAIAGLDSTKANVETLKGATATADIRVEVVETDGKLTAVNVTDTLKAVAHSGQASDVVFANAHGMFTGNNIPTDVEKAIADVMAKANQLDAAQLSAGNGISITDKKINSDFVVTIENREANGDQPAGEYIVIKGKGENATEITSVNANAFVKDGFLQKVEIIEATAEGQENVLRFTWNSDAGIQVTDIKVSELCDVYTAKENDWVVLKGFEFSHKTVTGLDSENAHGITEAVTIDSTTEESFTVPTLKVDAAGHVVSVDEQTVTIKLPGSIDTAIQDGAGVDTTYIQTTVGRNTTNSNQLDVTATAVIGTFPVDGESQVDGLATVAAVVDYVQENSATVSGYTKTVGEGESAVSTVVTKVVETPNENGSTNYQVQLPEITVTNENTNTNDMTNNVTTHSYITSIETDGFGRVVKTVSETMTENFDAGTY